MPRLGSLSTPLVISSLNVISGLMVNMLSDEIHPKIPVPWIIVVAVICGVLPLFFNTTSNSSQANTDNTSWVWCTGLPAVASAPLFLYILPRSRELSPELAMATAYVSLALFVLGVILPPGLLIWQKTRRSEAAQSNKLALGGSPGRQEYRNRQALLNKVENIWVKGYLDRSLYRQARLELGLEERPDAVQSHPWRIEWERPDQLRQTLPPGTNAIDKFIDLGSGGTLLILGEPGSGKTTTLLELARDLIGLNRRNIQDPIPVVFKLSSWESDKGSQPQDRRSFADWLVEELSRSPYQVPKQLGKTWVEEQLLLLLLDGLDEVSAEHRDTCVEAINQFSQEHGVTEIVVCSRAKDYEALSNRLRFQGAIFIQPLTREQINQYLDQAGAKLAGVKTALQTDQALQELTETPLMLSIISLTYAGTFVEALPKMNVEERRNHLFDKYIEQMFTRRRTDPRYPKEKTISWLIYLAQRMSQVSQTVFLIERIQPTWLQTKTQRIIYRIGNVLIFGLTLGLMGGLILGLMGGLTSGLMGGLAEIETVETLKFSWDEARSGLTDGLMGGLILGLILGLMGGLTGGLMGGLTGGLMGGLTGGLTASLMFWLMRGLMGGLEPSKMEMKTIPNQGIRRSVRNAGIVGLIFGLIIGLMGGLTHGVINGLMGGLMGGLARGGGACIQHFTLRLIIYRKGHIPWNYARFLDYATDHIFLQKVGGGYIFIHRLLQEHFASLKAG